MTDTVFLSEIDVTPYERLLPDNFKVLPVLTRYPPSLDLHIEKVSNPRILTVPANFKTPLNLSLTNAYQTKIPFCKYIQFLQSYANLYFSLSAAIYPTTHIALSHSLLL
jgi:hypothetical protein